MTYSSSLSLGRQRVIRRHQNAVSFQEQVRTIGPISNTIILIVLTCLLGLLYLTQVTKTNAYGYRINELKQHQAQLRVEHNDLEVAAARLQALERAKHSDVAKSMVPLAASGTVTN